MYTESQKPFKYLEKPKNVETLNHPLHKCLGRIICWWRHEYGKELPNQWVKYSAH